MAIRVQTGRVVILAYRLSEKEGRLIEDRTPENPMEYVHGEGQVLPAIERRLEGKTAGHRAEFLLSPREAYGEYDPLLVAEMPRGAFPESMDITVGMKFNTTGPDGKPVIVRVIEVSEDTVTVDGNHPLAGLELVFELRILDVREPGSNSDRLH